MSVAPFLSYNWPRSCPQLQFQHSGEQSNTFMSHFTRYVTFKTHFYFFLSLTNLSPSLCVVPPSCSVLSRLKKLEPGAVPAQYSQLLDCMCSWGQAGDILELVTEWLTEALPKQRVSEPNRSKSRKQTRRAKDVLYAWYVFLAQILMKRGLTVIFLSPSGKSYHQSKGAHPGDGGGQTRPGPGVPGVPVQPHLHTTGIHGAGSETTESAPHSSG